MASPGVAPIQITIDPPSGSGPTATHALLAAMLHASEKISDLIFSPGRPPQVEMHGQLVPLQGPGLRNFTADDTRRIASDLIGNNKLAITTLREQGSCDISFGLPGLARFRVNGPLSNMPAFAQAYQCKDGDAMVRPPDKRCQIW